MPIPFSWNPVGKPGIIEVDFIHAMSNDFSVQILIPPTQNPSRTK